MRLSTAILLATLLVSIVGCGECFHADTNRDCAVIGG